MALLHSPKKINPVDNINSLSTTGENRILHELSKISQQIECNTQKLATLEMEIKASRTEAQTEINNLKQELKTIELQIKSTVQSAEINKSRTDQNMIEIAKLFAVAHANQLQLKGIPHTEQEDITDVFNKICNSIKVRNPPILESIFRLNKGTNKNGGVVIVKFSSIRDRNHIFNQYMQNTTKCNTTALGFQSNSRIYFSECIHPSIRLIFNKAQLMKKNRSIQKVHVRNGLVHIQQSQNSGFVCITSVEQLDQTINVLATTSATHLSSSNFVESAQNPSNTDKTISEGAMVNNLFEFDESQVPGLLVPSLDFCNGSDKRITRSTSSKHS